MLLKKMLVRAGVATTGAIVMVSANAASVLDAAAKTAITTGFTDMKDTALDVVTSMWPMYLGIFAVMFGPKIVKRMAKSV